MKKQKFKSILLLAIFSLAFILGGCSSNTSQGDSSNETVVEAPASSYCKNGTHMYVPDPSIEGKDVYKRQVYDERMYVPGMVV